MCMCTNKRIEEEEAYQNESMDSCFARLSALNFSLAARVRISKSSFCSSNEDDTFRIKFVAGSSSSSSPVLLLPLLIKNDSEATFA